MGDGDGDGDGKLTHAALDIEVMKSTDNMTCERVSK
jgi:hypothetical protein